MLVHHSYLSHDRHAISPEGLLSGPNSASISENTDFAR